MCEEGVDYDKKCAWGYIFVWGKSRQVHTPTRQIERYFRTPAGVECFHRDNKGQYNYQTL